MFCNPRTTALNPVQAGSTSDLVCWMGMNIDVPKPRGSTSPAQRVLTLPMILLGASAPAHTQSPIATEIAPSTLFVQAGAGDNSTKAYLVGVAWGWSWRQRFLGANITGYVDADFGRWTTRQAKKEKSVWATQIGASPVIRTSAPGRWSRWFAELGVGPNYIVPLFRSGHKRFSTEFNFGDHAAIGRALGHQRRQEVALRVEHFSNAGLGHPNPGENFIQLRYSIHL